MLTTKGPGFFAVAMLVTLASCSGKHRPFSNGVSGTGGTANEADSEGVSGGSGAQPGLGEAGPGVAPQGQEGLPTVGAIEPGAAVDGEAPASCDSDAGICASIAEGIGNGCVPTGRRDCTSALDNDCDGQPDNVVDDVCVCAPSSVEPCDEHPGLDGRGQCRAGSRTCVVGEGNITSWSACEGSVGPAEEDSCATLGDDSNCDGTNNGGCPCVDGEARPCGPDTDDGICQRGTQTCVNGSFGACLGAVFAAPRDCSSNQDNDCDGRPDSSVDNVCTCAIGSTRACGAHPGRDGNGQCRAGSQRCEGRADNATSTFGACTGSVGPALQDSCADGNDGNCNGIPNEGCACVNGASRGCGPDTEVGLCQRGTQTCTNGSFGACQGAVFPAPRNCASPQDNDCDGRPDNTLDNVCQPPFTCGNADPPETVLPLDLMSRDSNGVPLFPPGPPPNATGGTIRNGRYTPIRVDVYGQANAPAFVVFEMTFEFRDGFVQVGYRVFIGTGAVLGSDEVHFVGTATTAGTSLQFDVDSCATGPCTGLGGISCDLPASLAYSATANGLVTIQPASDGSTVVVTYSRQ